MSQRIESGICPVAGTDRPLTYLGATESISEHRVEFWECQVCGAEIHVPSASEAPFGRHRKADCRIECLDMGT